MIGTGRRTYRVAAGCFEPDESLPIRDRVVFLEEHLRAIIDEQKPDLVVLPETALVPDFYKMPGLGAETLDGRTVNTVSCIAAEHSTSICIPIIEDAGDRLYNTAVFIDSKGQIAGSYRKFAPTDGEMDLGIHPGERDQVAVDLDGLKIGTAICFDENYPDLIWNWFRKRVDLLVFPSYTYGGKLMASWALMCGVPLISTFPWESAIYDRDGSMLADGGTWTSTVRFGYHPAWICCDLDMQSRIYHLADNQEKLSEIRAKYGRKVDIRLMVREAHMLITVRDNDLCIEDLESDMRLVPLYDYIVNARVRADKLR
jgi:predicted amidohydrolase